MVTSKYGPDTPVLDFCVDLLLGSGEMIAVTCDLCKGKKICEGGDEMDTNPDNPDNQVCRLPFARLRLIYCCVADKPE